MAELVTMYPAQKNSPETSLSGALTAAGTSATVMDGSALPSAPNLLTIGADSNTAETVLMTAKNGNVITIVRAQDGTTARAWAAGDTIGRYFTAGDQNALQENINRLNSGKAEKVSGSVNNNFVAFDGSAGSMKDSGKKAADFANASHTHSGYTEKVASPTDGNLVAFDGTTGAQKDSGKKAADFANASHAHSGYTEKVASPTDGNFVAFNGTLGAQKDSGKSASDFAAASHGHSGYAEVKIFSSVSVASSAWASDTTYAAYPFAATISCSGVTANHVPEVNFGAVEAAGGNFAPVALSGSGTVKIYAAVMPTTAITIQSIVCVKAV